MIARPPMREDKPLETCWTLIDRAAAGDAGARDEFAQRYRPIVRSCLAAHWHDRPYLPDLEDAIQEVFVECFEPNGVLSRADSGRKGGFRAFFYGVVRRTAQKFETRRARSWRRRAPESFQPERVQLDETTLSRVFDRTWALSVVSEARELQRVRAVELGADALQRVDILAMRFQEGLPVREIAARTGLPAEKVHRAYHRARQEYKACLREVLGLHEQCTSEQLERSVDRVLEILNKDR